MVSAKALLALYAISGIVYSYPIHRNIEDSSESHLTTRAPRPRFRNPFDVDSYLKNLDYKIPNNKDIQEWVKEARKKGALAASGKFSGDNDEDEEEDHDDDHDDDDEDHKTKATPRVSGEDHDDEDEDDHDHDQHTAQSTPRPDDEHDDEHDDDEDDDDDNNDEAAQPIQSAQPSSPTTSHESSTLTSTPTTADSTAVASTPNHEGGEENNIEVMQPAQPAQPTRTQDSSAPASTPLSTAPSVDTPNPQHNDKTDDDEDNEDETNQVMQPNDAQDSATPTTPSNTINGGDDAAPPAVQTVYVPVNVFPTRFPNFPDIDDDEKPSPSSTPLPIFPPPKDITKANLPPSTEESADTNGSEVSEVPVAEDAPTTPDVAATPDVAEDPVKGEPPSDTTDSTTYTPRPQMPSHEAQLSKVSELLDMLTPKDQSEKSY